MSDKRTDVLYGTRPETTRGGRGGLAHATGIVARFFKIQDERS